MGTKEEYNIEEIRKVVAELQKTLVWYERRHLEIVYDWVSYGHPKIMALLNLCKVKTDGELKKKDKRGAWR